MKSWFMEKLGEEHQFNRREIDLMRREMQQNIQQAQTSRGSAVEHGWSSLYERGVNGLGERLREVERELQKKNQTVEEVEKMADRMRSMEKQMAKMEEDQAREKKEMAERESERKREMEEERAREKKKMAERESERKREMEEERARQREMDKRESERKKEMGRYAVQMEEERANEKKEMEKMVKEMEAWMVERERMEGRQIAIERTVEGVEASLRTTAIEKLEDRMDQIEDTLTSLRKERHLRMELEQLQEVKTANLEKQYSSMFLEALRDIEKSLWKLNNSRLVEGTTTPPNNDQGDYRLEAPMEARSNICRTEGRDDERMTTTRRGREEHLLSPAESRGERGREREKESSKRKAQVVESKTSSSVCSKAGRTSDGSSSTSVNTEMGKNDKRGIFSWLFQKNDRRH